VAEPDLVPGTPATGDGAAAAPLPEPRWGFGDAAIGFVVALVLSFVSASIVLAITGEDDTDGLSITWMTVANTGLWAGLVGSAWFVTRRKGNGLVRDLGLRIEARDVPVGVFWGLLSQLVIVPLIYVPIIQFTSITWDDVSEPARDLSDRASGPVGVAVLVFFVAICAPICEEIFYRGLVLRSLERSIGVWPGIVLTGVIFGAAHLQPIQFLPLAVFGGILSWLVIRSGRLGVSIAAHMTFNTIAVVTLLGNR
jgi:membrane protease YdiL (CAAX protease family)